MIREGKYKPLTAKCFCSPVEGALTRLVHFSSRRRNLCKGQEAPCLASPHRRRENLSSSPGRGWSFRSRRDNSCCRIAFRALRSSSSAFICRLSLWMAASSWPARSASVVACRACKVCFPSSSSALRAKTLSSLIFCSRRSALLSCKCCFFLKFSTIRSNSPFLSGQP